MAYVATNPAQVKVQGLGNGPSWWHYSSTDIHTDVDATDYFTNGSDLGMRVNDVVIVVKTSATIGATLHVVTAVTAGGAATVSPAILV